MSLLYRCAVSALCVWTVWINLNVTADKPCAARWYPGSESCVCVCNSTYCDEIQREQAELGKFVYYTSSKSGLRFAKKTGSFFYPNGTTPGCVSIKLYPEEVYQTILGFGSSVTDSAGLNWRNLPYLARKNFINTHFGKKGLEYNMIRTPIGGSDFSTYPYTLCDYPEDDKYLYNFSLAYEDYLFKIPMIKDALKASDGNALVLASCWSPPMWMKTNKNITGRGFVLQEYFQTYADYHLKFIQEYAYEGIPIWGVTTTNEPYNGLHSYIPFNTCGWTPKSFGIWISQNLGPTLRNSPFNVKILCCDDQRYNIPIWFNKMIDEVPESLDYVDGVSIHWYGNFLTTPDLFKLVTTKHADKFIISSEACEGWMTNDVKFGSWTRAQTYCSEIISDLNNNLVGWIDWNICLDEVGGPNWVNNYVDSPCIVLKEHKEFVKQPMFYSLGHFSKWVRRGSLRISVEVEPCEGLELTAFRTPEQNVVVVIQNLNTVALCVAIKVGYQEAQIELEASSITTVEFPFTTLFFQVQPGYVRPAQKKPTENTFARPRPYPEALPCTHC